MFGPLDAAAALFFLKAFELGHGGQQRPGLIALGRGLEPQVTTPARDTGFKGEPGIDHPIGLGGLAFERKVRRLHIGQPRLQHGLDGTLTFLGANVPGERHQIPPVAVGVKQGRGLCRLALAQGILKARQPILRPLRGGLVTHGFLSW